MNLALLLSVTIGLFSCQCLCYNVRTTALRPRGFRACLESEKGIESFSFYAYDSKSRWRLEGNATSPTDGLWCYTKRDITLNINDEIVYWYRVVKNGEQNQSETEKKKFKASDFVDESGIYRPISTATSGRSPPRKSFSSRTHQSQEPVFVTAAAKVAQQEQTDYEEPGFRPVQPVTPERVLPNHIIPQQPAAKDQLTASEQQTLSEIFENFPPVPNNENLNNGGYAETITKLEPQEYSEVEGQHKVIEPLHLTIVDIGKKTKNRETDDRLIISPPTDLTLQQKDDKILTIGTGEYDYPAAEDSININIIINRKASPCNTSVLFGVPKIDTKPRMPGSVEDITSSHKNKTKSCETLLSHEKKLSEAVRNSYQDCILKVDVVENDLIDSKKEARILSALLKETLKMINYLRVNSTNKLILKSSIPLIDYKQTLREVIHVLLDVTPAQYNIVKSELEGDKIVKFEVNAYNEKLLLFLNGRIKLPSSNFQLIDYDAHVLHQKQV